MRYKISHELIYKYSKPVFFEPHTFFIRPREDAHQRLLDFRLSLSPEPELCAPAQDAFGNNMFRAWFHGNSDSLEIRAESEVEVLRENPFDYFLEDNFMILPANYLKETFAGLKSYRTNKERVTESVTDFAARIALRMKGSVEYFLSELCREISVSFHKIERAEGAPWAADVTLEKKEGACRDLAAFFMECCRSQGLISRFVSGYYGKPDGSGKYELHAWAEVYLEGAGWRGYDPSTGLACMQSHVVLASAPDPLWVSPVIGTFRGNKISSSLEAKVEIKILDGEKVFG